MKHFLTALAFLLTAATANADVHRIKCRQADGTDYGTAFSIGVLKDGRTVFFTAAHCVKTNNVMVADPKAWNAATVHYRKQTSYVDVAIVTARLTKQIKVATPISTSQLQTGTQLKGQGFAGENPGSYHGRVRMVGTSNAWMSGVAPFGTSGGPVWKGNSVVGITSAIEVDRRTGRPTGKTVFTTTAFAQQQYRTLFRECPT